MTKKLSEMIWDGSKKRPAIDRGWFGRREGEIKTCAIAAAIEDAGLLTEENGTLSPSGGCETVRGRIFDRATGRYTERVDTTIVPPKWFREMMDIRVIPPCGCSLGQATFFETVPHLHDVHRWTREATAMWVESVEKAIETALADPCPGWGGRAPAPVEVKAESVLTK